MGRSRATRVRRSLYALARGLGVTRSSFRVGRRPNRALVEVDTAFGPLLAYEDDVITRHLRRHGAHTRTDLAFLLGVVDPGDDVFDLGAHVGTFTVPLALAVAPEGRVLAVEGAPATHAVLAENLARRDLDGRCRAVCAIVAPDHGSYRLVEHHANSGASRFRRARRPRGGGAVRTFAELVDAHFVPRVVKLDLEGFEHAVLRQADLGSAGYPILFAEVSRWRGRGGGSAADIDRLLRDQGYRFFGNAAPSHAPHDRYEAVELASLPAAVATKLQANVLAVHAGDRRLGRLPSAGGLRHPAAD